MKKATKRAKKVVLPPLPDSVFSVHGPIPVVLTDDPRILDPNDFGCWNAHDRVIYIRTGMSRTVAWLTYFHEVAHAQLADVDFNITHEVLENICNALAAARFAEMRDTLPRGIMP